MEQFAQINYRYPLEQFNRSIRGTLTEQFTQFTQNNQQYFYQVVYTNQSEVPFSSLHRSSRGTFCVCSLKISSSGIFTEQLIQVNQMYTEQYNQINQSFMEYVFYTDQSEVSLQKDQPEVPLQGSLQYNRTGVPLKPNSENCSYGTENFSVTSLNY